MTDNYPNADMIAFYERKAVGGAAAVCVGDCIVDTKTGRHYPFLMDMKDQNTLPGLSQLASAISRHGAVASAELSHAGMYAGDSFQRSGKLYGPVAMENKYGKVEEMSEEMIKEIIESYANAALWAKRCGFQMVTIHGGHGWLLSQFFSPKINTRKDMWGGSLENRLRLPLAVCRAIKKAAGRNFTVEYRLSGSEVIDSGYGIGDGIDLAKALDGEVDIIHVSAGYHEDPQGMVITHPSMFLDDCCNAKYAAEIKKYVKTPVATVGAFRTPDEIEEVIATGQADVVALGRQSLADPDTPVKARSGRADEITSCIRCMTCFGGEGEHRFPECALNPEICQEAQYKLIQPPKQLKKVLVVGGGPGGMEAAITAKRRGHEVILCEKSDLLGGTLRCERLVPFKQNLMAYLDHQEHMLAKLGVEVRKNTEVTKEYAEEIAADVIIAATGAKPVKPPIPGIDLPNVKGADEVYVKPELAGEKVVILGGGLVGIELGLFLSGLGKKVTIIEMLSHLSVHEFSMHSLALEVEIPKRGIQVYLSTAASEIKEDRILAKGPEGELEISCDTVIYATGQAPQRASALALAQCAPEFIMLGDCNIPKNIHAATSVARLTTMDIGMI